MMPGPDGSEDFVQATDHVIADTADTADTAETGRDAVNESAAGLEAGTAAAADEAQSANREGAQVVADASHATAAVFGAARERLNAMASTMPGPAQELLRPFRTGSEAFGKGVESSYATAMEGMAEFNSKAVAAWRSNAESTIRHWQSLASVKSFSEVIALSAEHTRKQLEAVTSQTRELSALATRIVRDAADPLKMTGR